MFVIALTSGVALRTKIVIPGSSTIELSLVICHLDEKRRVVNEV